MLDGLWLGGVGRKVCEREIGELMHDKPSFVAAAIFHVFGVTALVVQT